ncbi:peptide chain release factor PrfB3, chloroplastic-like isoform X1 [Coffea arabica]|uniref:Peptide chain release factor PrfB3, chloroplastic-like isoform X1 n=1 Tax=Coffea arabica TaxID=13443 RepID=A0A6P6SI68_COFAR|nr:peptide chain release factor PrfB3, chloroplastic-like isoform X1 [Coffea arabica]
MAKVAAEPISLSAALSSSASSVRRRHKSSRIRASQPLNDKSNSNKQLGMFALRKKIEDSILSAEILAPTALEQEEARHIQQEKVIRECNLWDDIAQANEFLVKLAESDKVVDALKDLRYKAEEAKLIMELAEMDAINDGLFNQAYSASVYVNKYLKKYEMSKLLNEPYEREGACITIESGHEGIHDERWAEQLVQMYIKWAEKQGHKWRIIEKFPSKNGGIKSAILEFESNFVYGYLMGERGVHRMIKASPDGSLASEGSSATVDVIPLFLESVPDIFIDDKVLMISFSSIDEEYLSRTSPSVHIQHIPTGFTVKATGERSQFANKMKALNRLKAKLLIVLENQRISKVEDIDRSAIVDLWCQETTRRYVFYPAKLVQDVKTGIQLPDLTSVLNGNIEPLIVAHINNRRSCNIIT